MKVAAGSKKDEKKEPVPDQRRGSTDPLFADIAPPEIDPKDEQILKMLEAGKKYREIQKELKVGAARIAEVAAAHGKLGEQRKREEVKKAILLFDDQFIGQIIEMPFDLLARRFGEHWRLSPDEKQKLAVLSNKVSSKYLPLWLERFADEISLALMIGAVVYPRYLMTKTMVEAQGDKEVSPVETQLAA